MSRFKVDLDNVAKQLDKKSFKLSEVKDKIEKVAFDIVKFKDSNSNELWQIQSSDDGEYIVALYEEDKVATANLKALASTDTQPWEITVKNADLYVFYNKEYFCKIAGTKLGFQEKDLNLVKKYLPNKLAANKTLVKSLINSLDRQTIQNILSKFPELA